ncbi:MAG TPA: helical backbone metal receptor, partial [Patescibacteria group bacterium]|nr:helical backbone metal receptor [Patescibacteria group bacterium]
MGFSWLAAAVACVDSADAGPRVLDGAGRDVKVPARPARIVSLAPSVTEILFAMGAGERVVGVTDYCDFPPEARSRTRIGGLINPDLEKIVSLKPDLAMATTTGNYLDDAERIERLGIPVYTINTPTVESMLKTLETIGDLVGEPARSRTLSGQLRSRIDQVRVSAGRHVRVRTLFVIEGDPLIAPGRGTFLGEALAIAGADLVTKDAPASWGQYDLEQVIRMKPELLLTAEPNRGWALGLTRRPEWLGIPAVAGHHVVVISDSIQHPGPRLVDGIEEVGKIVQS